MEGLSFGACVGAFKNIKKLEDKKNICEIFGFHPTAIESWIRALRYTRNICAHHARLWNRWFVVCPSMRYIGKEHLHKERTFYAQAFIIDKLISSLFTHFHWEMNLFMLMEKYQYLPLDRMGFAKHWKNDKFWI